MTKKKRETPTERVDDAVRVTEGRIPMVVAFEDDTALSEARERANARGDAGNLRLVTRAQLDSERRELRRKWAEEDAATQAEATE